MELKKLTEKTLELIEMHFDGTKAKQYIDFTKAVEIVKGGGVNE